MIKFYRKIRYNLIETGKTGKYFKYAIGEIILVVIGILIALSINNWNEKQKEKKQIHNIYARVVKDFENSVAEIEDILVNMNADIPLIQSVVEEEVNRDSLLADNVYFFKYVRSSTSFDDIQIQDKGVRLLESKISLNYDLNTEYSEDLFLLYSEYLYEIEVNRIDLTDFLKSFSNYKASKGLGPPLLVKNGINRHVDLIYEDDVYKNRLAQFLSSYRSYRNKLRNFKTQGEVLIDEIKIEYNLE